MSYVLIVRETSFNCSNSILYCEKNFYNLKSIFNIYIYIYMSGAYSKKGNGLRKIDPKDRKIDQKYKIFQNITYNNRIFIYNISMKKL